MKKKLSSFLRRNERGYFKVLMTVMILCVVAIPIQAAEPTIISGTKKLLTDATKWLTGLIPVGVGLFLGYHALQKAMSDDQALIAEKNRMMKNALVGGAIAMTASGLVSFLLTTYFPA